MRGPYKSNVEDMDPQAMVHRGPPHQGPPFQPGGPVAAGMPIGVVHIPHHPHPQHPHPQHPHPQHPHPQHHMGPPFPPYVMPPPMMGVPPPVCVIYLIYCYKYKFINLFIGDGCTSTWSSDFCSTWHALSPPRYFILCYLSIIIMTNRYFFKGVVSMGPGQVSVFITTIL